VDDVMTDLCFKIKMNGTEIKKIKKRFAAPGEMEFIDLCPEDLRGGGTLELEAARGEQA